MIDNRNSLEQMDDAGRWATCPNCMVELPESDLATHDTWCHAVWSEPCGRCGEANQVRAADGDNKCECEHDAQGGA